MISRPHIVYLTFDGILEPIGYSQVARVMTQLAQGGRYRITICSLEKAWDRDDGDREVMLEAELRRRQVRWRRACYTPGGGPVAVARNMRAMRAMVDELVDVDGVDLIHARSYMAATVARGVKKDHGVAYLFDTRGFWVDERVERDRWFLGAVGERAGRIWERSLYGDADAVVTLTELAAKEIADQKMGPFKAHRPMAVIPTSVDYDEFVPAMDVGAGQGSEVVDRLAQASLVVGYVGSVNKAYKLDASLRLFDHVLSRKPEAHLLCLTRTVSALTEALKRHRIPSHSYTVKTVAHEEMPAWLCQIEWGLLLRNTRAEDRSYLGAMPTKLAEFFASGVRPVYRGHSQEVQDWIEKAGSGHVMDDCDEASIRRAADKITRTPRCLHTLWGARWRTRSHFGLERAVKRYDDIYQSVLERHRPARMRVLFLTRGAQDRGAELRAHQLAPYLRKRGIECVVCPSGTAGHQRRAISAIEPLFRIVGGLRQIPQALEADRFDAIVMQRPKLAFGPIADKVAQWRNEHTILDIDNSILMDIDGDDEARNTVDIEAVVDGCAHIICGTEELAASLPDQNTRTSVIPTVVDSKLYRCRRTGGDDGEGEGSQITVGWMGPSARFGDLEEMAASLRRVIEGRTGVRLEIISDRPFEPLEGVDSVEYRRWEKGRHIQDLQRFDIAVVPVGGGDRGQRGRWQFRIIEHLAASTAVIASDGSVDDDMLCDGQALVVAGDALEFEAGLRMLIDDAPMRQRLAKNGRTLVEARYSVTAVVNRYVQLLEAVARRPAKEDDSVEQWSRSTALRRLSGL